MKINVLRVHKYYFDKSLEMLKKFVPENKIIVKEDNNSSSYNIEIEIENEKLEEFFKKMNSIWLMPSYSISKKYSEIIRTHIKGEYFGFDIEVSSEILEFLNKNFLKINSNYYSGIFDKASLLKTGIKIESSSSSYIINFDMPKLIFNKVKNIFLESNFVTEKAKKKIEELIEKKKEEINDFNFSYLSLSDKMQIKDILNKNQESFSFKRYPKNVIFKKVSEFINSEDTIFSDFGNLHHYITIETLLKSKATFTDDECYVFLIKKEIKNNKSETCYPCYRFPIRKEDLEFFYEPIKKYINNEDDFNSWILLLNIGGDTRLYKTTEKEENNG